MPVLAYIGLGSNLGDRKSYLDRAVQLLRQTPGIEHLRTSRYYETDPVGGPLGQGKYLNAVAQLGTTLDPEPLLRVLLDIENKLGRVRTEPNGPRTLDLDLLLFGNELVNLSGQDLHLVVPHPRMHERLFVLEPLAEIAPLAVHPGLQSTVRDLLNRLRGQGQRELTGLRALVTGSSSGIGRAIALELARGGANVVVHGRSEQRTEEVTEQVRAFGADCIPIVEELRDEKGCQRVLDVGWRSFDGLDIWINNAGADTLTGEAAQWPFERKLAELWAVDVLATMRLSRAVGERMKQRGRGIIINMGWDQAETGMAGDSGQLFGAVKGAVMAFSKSLALSLAPQVRVLCLAPGWIRTAWGDQASKIWQERVLRETPLGRWGTPTDVAATVRWLVSPAASFITGQVIRINGGAV